MKFLVSTCENDLRLMFVNLTRSGVPKTSFSRSFPSNSNKFPFRFRDRIYDCPQKHWNVCRNLLRVCVCVCMCYIKVLNFINTNETQRSWLYRSRLKEFWRYMYIQKLQRLLIQVYISQISGKHLNSLSTTLRNKKPLYFEEVHEIFKWRVNNNSMMYNIKQLTTLFLQSTMIVKVYLFNI